MKVCEQYKKDRRGQLNHILYINTQGPISQLHPVYVSQCDKFNHYPLPAYVPDSTRSQIWSELVFLVFTLRITWYENKYKERSKCYIKVLFRWWPNLKKTLSFVYYVQDSLCVWWSSPGLKGERKKLKPTDCSKISSHAFNTIACLMREDSHITELPPESGHNGVCWGPHEQRKPPYLIKAYTYVF